MERDFIRSMFDTIAPHYDFLNRLLSARQDVYWRREMVRALDTPDSPVILDAACGTGDVIMEVLKQKPTATVWGIDFAPEMLAVAHAKLDRHFSDAPVRLLAANVLYLPFEPNCMDAVTIAFGIRNIADRKSALSRFHKVLKPGGTLAVLELNTPPPGHLRSLYLLYFQKILPGIGGFFSKNMSAYQYLPASVLNFPRPADFAGIMRETGFNGVAWKSLTLGIATLYIGRKSR